MFPNWLVPKSLAHVSRTQASIAESQRARVHRRPAMPLARIRTISVLLLDTIGFLRRNGAFRRFVFPAASLTWPTGINAQREIVRFHLDTNLQSHGFLLRRGN